MEYNSFNFYFLEKIIMTDTQIICPKCGFKFSLSDAHKQEIDDIVRRREKELENSFLEEQKKREEKFLEEQIKKEEDIKKEMWIKAQSVSQKQLEEKLKNIDQEAKEKEIELENLRKRDEESRKKELEFLREKQALEQKQKDWEIEKEKAIIAERKKIEEEFSKQSYEKFEIEFEKKQLEYEKKMQEKEKQMEALKKSLDEATRKANQWSMQIQWEIQEDALKNILKANFPIDDVRDVEKWIKGADIIQIVKNKFWQDSWIIVWESKNTKAWSDSWVEKLREDRTLVKASLAIIVTNTLPEGIKHFALYKDIWVTSWEYVIPLTFTLRENIIALEHMKNSLAGKDEKMEIIYNYLTSSEFKAKIENIIEAFSGLKDELEREKRAMEKIWASREKQLDRVLSNTSRLYGDMQGLIGSNFQKIETLELPFSE